MATEKSAVSISVAQVFHSEDICERVGERIRSFRLAKGWSQQFLADHAELSKVHLIAIEKGRVEPGLRALERIAKVLGVPLRSLIDP